MRFIITIFFIFLSAYSAFAVKAYPYPIEVTQPDGTKLTLIIKGDEYFRYRITKEGYLVSRAKDGFYHHANYSSGKLSSIVARNIRESNIRKMSFSKAEDNSIKKKKTIIIPVEFADVKFLISNPTTHFDRMVNMNGYSDYGATGSVKEYFTDNIGDKYEFEFVVSEVVSLPHDLSYYGADDETDPLNVIYDKGVRQMIYDACKVADDYVDFSQFDIDGDGKVDNVFVIFAGHNEAEGGSPNSIWPLTWSIESLNCIVDGVKISNFSCTSELRGSDGTNPAGIGTFCHEYGHSIGLLDVYDTDYEENGQSKGLWGSLSLMDAGNYNNQGRTPPFFTAIDRELAGFTHSDTLRIGEKYTLKPISSGDFIKVKTKKENEYFLLETRKESGWDSFIGGSGMLVYHIDKSTNIAGEIRAETRWKTNTINTYSGHECADLVEAVPSAVNVRQIFFPGLGGVSEYNSDTQPRFMDWSYKTVGVALSEIREVSEGVTFEVKKDDLEKMLPVLSPIVTSYQNSANLQWNTSVETDSKWGILWGEKLKSQESFTKIELTQRKHSFTELSPGTDYLCKIFYIGETGNGDTVSIEFSTMNISSDFPYIHGIKKEYYVGESIDLQLFNIVEGTNKIEWFIDGRSFGESTFIAQHSGIVDIRVEITYSKDKSVEVIRKRIIIKNKEEKP